MRALLALAVLCAACGACTGARTPANKSTNPAQDLDVDWPEPPAVAPREERPAVQWQPSPASLGGARTIGVRRYRGRRIDLDLVEADLHNVLRLLADVGGVNLVVADDVRGAVTIRLRAVPWDQALGAIVKLKDLELKVDGSIYQVSRRGPVASP